MLRFLLLLALTMLAIWFFGNNEPVGGTYETSTKQTVDCDQKEKPESFTKTLKNDSRNIEINIRKLSKHLDKTFKKDLEDI